MVKVDMNWRLVGKVLFVLSAVPWAMFIYTLISLDDLGLTLDSFWPVSELLIALVMMVLGLWLALRKKKN